MGKYFVSTLLIARTPTVSLTGERNGTFKFKRGIVLLKDEYIDTAVKMIIAVVLGSLLLTGLYQMFNSVVLPGLADRIQSMF